MKKLEEKNQTLSTETETKQKLIDKLTELYQS